MKINQKIKQFRERLGLTQQQVANLVYVSESTIGNYETGKRNPSIELLQQIAHVLKVDISDFFEEEQKSLLQFPMYYKEFINWGIEMEDRHGYGWFTDYYFEYHMKSDRYFVELKNEYLIWLKDGFYLVPVKKEFVDSEYNDVVKISDTRKVVKKDIPYIEREIRRSNLVTYDEKLFSEQVYVSKYDFQNPIINEGRISLTDVESVSVTSNHIMSYMESEQSFYVLSEKGILKCPIEEEFLEYYKEENINLPYGIYEEEELYVETSKVKLVNHHELEQIKKFMEEEEYLVQRLFLLVKKEISNTQTDKKLTFKQIQEEIDELEKEEAFHENDKDVISHFLRYRIWSLDNFKRMLQSISNQENSIFDEEWKEEKEIKKELADEWEDETRKVKEKKKEKLREHFSKEYKVLLVEDSIFWRMAVKTEMENQILCEVDQAKNGQEALDMYKNEYENGHPYDLVIMDITMPVMNGIQALEKITVFDKNACVVMFSSLSSEQTVKKCLNLGAKNFVVKGIGEESLYDICKKELLKK